MDQRSQPVGEPHRIAGLTPPVGCIEAPGRFSGDIGDNINASLGVGQCRRRPLQGIQARFDQRRMERAGHRQRPAIHAFRRQCRRHPRHRLTLAGNHRRCRPVLGSDRDLPRAMLIDRLIDGIGIGQNCGHRPAFRQSLHQPAPFHREPQARFQIENACSAGRRQFANAVTQYRPGFHAPTTPQIGQRHFQREQGGLRQIGTRQQSLVFVEQHLQQWTLQLLVDQGSASIQRLLNARLRFVKSATGATAPCALTSEQESNAGWLTLSLTQGDGRRRFAGNPSRQLCAGLSSAFRNQRQSMREGGPAHPCGMAPIRPGFGAILQASGSTTHQFGQCIGFAGGKAEQLGWSFVPPTLTLPRQG